MSFEQRQNDWPPPAQQPPPSSPVQGGVSETPTTTPLLGGGSDLANTATGFSSTVNPSPPTSTSSSSKPSPSGPNAGAIAGGVIAGVILIALIIAAILFFRRRKHRMAPSTEFLARNPNWRSDTPTSTAELTGDEQPPPFTQGSYAYALLPEKRRSQPV